MRLPQARKIQRGASGWFVCVCAKFDRHGTNFSRRKKDKWLLNRRKGKQERTSNPTQWLQARRTNGAAHFALKAIIPEDDTSQEMLFELMPQRALTGDKDSDEWNQLRSLAVVAGVLAIWDIQSTDVARLIVAADLSE
jgi:hypothetical protein